MSRVVILFCDDYFGGSIGLMTFEDETKQPMFEERLNGFAQFCPSVNDPHPVQPERMYERGWQIIGEYYE